MSVFKFSKTMIKSLFSKPATRLYPVSKREFYANTRGSIRNDIDKCIFCGICVKKCPTGALFVLREDKEWAIDRLKCISCNACVEACPKKCLYMESTYSPAAVIKETDSFKQAPKPAEPAQDQDA